MSSDTSMRDQGDRLRKFTTRVIHAIEELELRRINRSQQQLADAAWQKLQYDLPLVETAELQALLDVFSASFEGKTGWPCYLLTFKALENITSGARRSSSYEPSLTEQEQQVQQITAELLAQKLLNNKTLTDNASSSNSMGALGAAAPATATAEQQQQQQEQKDPVGRQQLYQQLSAVVLLQYAAKVTCLPDQEAWQLMQAYHPELQEQPPLPQQQQHSDPDTLAGTDLSNQLLPHQLHQNDAAAAAAADLVGTAPDSSISQGSSCAIYEVQEASVLDEDGEEYEPLEPLQQQQPLHASSSHHQHQHHRHQHHQQQQQQDELFSWPALRQKLLSFSELVHYSLLDYEPLWRQQHAAEHLLQLLRLLGVHSHAQELQPLLHAYVGLLVDRLTAAPQDLPMLHQLWEALGLTGCSARPQRPPGFKLQASQEGLHAEAVLGLSVAAAVWQQLPGASARSKLWQLMHGDLLPLLEACSEQLAYSSRNSSSSMRHDGQASSTAAAGAAAAGTTGASAASSTAGAAFAHVLLLCHIIELLVLGRPSHVDIGQQLTDSGVTRNLVQLFVKWGGEAAAEPLRRAVLLACYSSSNTAAWVLAVPAVLQLLQQPSFQLQAHFESHGAVWHLLQHKVPGPTSTKQQQQSSTTATAMLAAGTGAAAVGEAGDRLLLALLGLEPGRGEDLQRQMVLLQLMVDAQRAAGGPQRLFSPQVAAALRTLAAQIKDLEGRSKAAADAAGADTTAAASTRGTYNATDAAGTAASAAAGDAGSWSSSSAEGSGKDDSVSGDESDESDDDKHGGKGRQFKARSGPHVSQLDRRRSAHLQPAALRLIKELLTQGGGKTD